MKHQTLLNQRIKSYTFYNLLGQGAFAKVYEAIDERDNSQIAIKAIPKRLMQETPKLEELVKTQIKVLQSCTNDNVIKFVDSFTSNKTVFIATQFCNGGDLEQYLNKKKRLTEDQATTFLKQIINGFRGLHEVGAMHRDFKLANVLLNNGICKIADLGFAKQMKQKSMTTTILGTSLTMAPQLLDQMPYGMEADLWSIGVVYYQMIYGKYPYTGMSDYQILKRIKSSRPDYSSVKISSECKDFIDKCLTVNPKSRIKWSQVYQHSIITKSDGRFIYGVLKSKISLGANKNYYDEKKFGQNKLYYPDIDEVLKQDFLDVDFQDGGEIRQSMNVNQIMEDAKFKKIKALAFSDYEKIYVNKRNNIMFIFKFICPFANTLVKFKANHGIAFFITSKKAYIDMKKLIQEIAKKTNIFELKNYWSEFNSSSNYQNIITQFKGDMDMIQAQALSYQFDIQIQSKQIQAQSNLKVIRSKDWNKLVTETINQYWFLLAQSLDKATPTDKEILIRILEALNYLRNNKTSNIEEFDKIMEVLNVTEAEKRVKKQRDFVFV